LVAAEHASYHPPLDVEEAPTDAPPKVQVPRPDPETGETEPITSTTAWTATEAETALVQAHKRTKSASRISRFLSVRWKFQSLSGSGARTAKTFSQSAILRRKFVFVGDGACGKTCLLMSASPFHTLFS
jgi:hypothetical protein